MTGGAFAPALGSRVQTCSPSRPSLNSLSQQRQHSQTSRRNIQRVSAHTDDHSSNSVGSSGDGIQQRSIPKAAKITLACAAAAAIPACAPALLGGGGGGGTFGFGGWGGGGGGGHLFSIGSAWADEAAEEDDDECEDVKDEEADGEDAEYEVDEADDAEGDEDEEAEEDFDDADVSDDDMPVPTGSEFFVSEIRVVGLPVGKGVPTEEELTAGLNCQPGFVCTKAELAEDIRGLYQMGVFDKVDAKVMPGRGRRRIINLIFRSQVHPEIKSFDVKGASLLPQHVKERVMKELPPGPTDLATLGVIKSIIEGWYQQRGYAYSFISHFAGLHEGKAVANVVESRVNSWEVVHIDDDGEPIKGGGTLPPEVVERELKFRKGSIYNLEDGKKALRDVFALQLFDNVQVMPKQSQDGKNIDVEVMVKERPMQTAEIETEWAIAPNDSGRPSLTSIVPGGTIVYEHRNLGPDAKQVSASVNAPNLLLPGSELGYRVDLKQPYAFGSRDPKKTAITASAFNVRKISGVFIPGPGGEEVPPVFIDRSGVKLSIHEQYTRNSKGTLSMVVQQVSALDEGGEVTPQGSRMVQVGGNAMLDPTGPPTTLSPTGVDRLAFLQGNITRDNTYYRNGQPIGARDILQVEQGLGIGTARAFFNRFVLSATRFVKLRDEPNANSPPWVLALHGRYGNGIGEMASYDAYTLGGPHSVRGFNVGELAACRSFAELGAEIRAPVLGKQLYAFAEHGTDLGSSKLVRGNPTEYYRRPGSGTSLGAGAKFGAVRVEYATEGSSLAKGHWYLRFGERF